MKKFVKFFAVAAIISMSVLSLSCDPAPQKPVVPETPEEPVKAVTTEAELIEMGTELIEEITAYFEAFAKTEGPVASMRSAEDPDVTAVMEFVGKIMEAAMDVETKGTFELTDASIDLKNLSAEKVLKILDNFVKTIEPDESIDNGLAELAEELEIAFGVKITVADLKAKLNECVKITKLKFNGNITADPIFIYREDQYSDWYKNIYATVNMENVNEAFGVDIQKLSDLLGFLTGSEKAFPVKNISLEENANIEKFAATVLIRDNLGTDPEDPHADFNTDKILSIDKQAFDGTASVKTAFDFATTKSKYAGNLSLSFDLTSSTETILKIMEDEERDDYESEKAYTEAMIADYNLLGSVTVKVTDGKAETFTATYKLGDLIAKIMESMPEPEEPVFN